MRKEEESNLIQHPVRDINRGPRKELQYQHTHYLHIMQLHSQVVKSHLKMNWFVCSHSSYGRLLQEIKGNHSDRNFYSCLTFKPSSQRTEAMPCGVTQVLPHLSSSHQWNQTHDQAKHHGYCQLLGERNKNRSKILILQTLYINTEVSYAEMWDFISGKLFMCSSV